MKALECSQDQSHYKSMGIFPAAQGQLTLKSMVGSGRISNLSTTLLLSSLPAKMKKIRSKMKALECSQNNTSHFSDAQGQITFELVVVSGRNLNSSKLSCMSSLPARMRMIESNMKELECSQDFSHYKYMEIFSRRSRAAHSTVLAPIWPNFELVRDVIDVLVTCKYEEDQIKNEGARVFTTFSQL